MVFASLKRLIPDLTDATSFLIAVILTRKQATAEQRNVVNFLRSKNGVKSRNGLLNGKRTDYFKGKNAIKALLSPLYAKQKNVPKVTTEEEAVKLLHSIIPCAFFLRVNRSAEGSPRVIQINPQQAFSPDGSEYYAWFYEGSQLWTMIAAFGMVACMLAAVLYPLWPYTMRLGVWYLSIGILMLLAAFFVLAIFRLIFYVITLVVARPGIWIFPRLFEDVSFMDSWTPVWGWDIPPKKKSSSKGTRSSKKEKKSFASAVASSGSTPSSIVAADGEKVGGTRKTYAGATVEEIKDDDA
ncbi:translocation protein [Phaffia rhodozyma]|uniref:Translocation protein SEC62 n=1 Tax=Phaffia rhodozyma TaxID=264483 RepID=A0A0F7SE39_PHARH|nr:translocation protein [Phaffia rhodozyma]